MLRRVLIACYEIDMVTFSTYLSFLITWYEINYAGTHDFEGGLLRQYGPKLDYKSLFRKGARASPPHSLGKNLVNGGNRAY